MLIQRWRNTVLNVATHDWWIRIRLNVFFHTYRICIHISLSFFQFKGQTCNFCCLKVPAHWSKLRKLPHYITSFISCMTKLSILKLFLEIMNHYSYKTKLVFSNMTLFTVVAALSFSGAEDVTWMQGGLFDSCTQTPPLAPGGERCIRSRAWPTCSLKHTAVWLQPCLSATVLLYTYFPCFVHNLWISCLLWCDTVGAASHRIEKY